MIDQLIFTDEAAVAGVPVPFLTINTVGPDDHAVRHRRAEVRSSCPGSPPGELHFSIGYSEPEAGTDLAALRTTAVRDGDDYVINGQKMWTSLIQYADYVWLACRTDPDAPRHKGLSIIIVPTDAPGFSCTPVHTVAGVSTSATYYSGRPRPGRQPGRRGERRLAADHQPAQPRARRADLGSAAAARAARGARLGGADQGPRTAARDRRRMGADCTWPGCTPRPRCSSC